MSKYLYGASVQGIQSFIFETNKLREIAGASQLIDNISSINWEDKKDLSEFEKYCNDFHEVDRKNIVMSAAGNIKYKVEDKDVLEKIVLGFPKYIANYAPGVTISQAVVEIEDEKDIQRSINKLEEKLKSQRNVVAMPTDIGFMGLERARRTGGVAFDFDEEDKSHIDRGISAKTELREEDTLNLFNKFTAEKVRSSQVPFDLKEITKQAENNSWIAIVHADGNGLGKILTNMSKNVDADKREVAFKVFSKLLDVATQKAAKKAFKVIEETYQKEIEKKSKENSKKKLDIKYSFRPVVLGGDDLTVIIRADLAYDFTKSYLKAFEECTREEFSELNNYFKEGKNIEGLTACAGIAYIKDSYPFHYGIHLAEELTGKAKKLSKSKEIQDKVGEDIIPSSLDFYKVQSSFTDNLEKMKNRTQYAEMSQVRFDYGPYFIDKIEDEACVKELDQKLEVLQKYKSDKSDKSKGVSKLRQWISELYKDEAKAKFMLDRIKSVNNNFYEKMNLKNAFTERTVKDENGDDKKVNFSIYNDLIQLHTFKQMYKTKKNEN